MTIKIKNGSAYVDAANIFCKKQGVYSAVLGVYEKINGVYTAVNNQRPLLVAAVNQRYGGGAFGAAGTTNRRGRQPIKLATGRFGGFLTSIVLGLSNKGTGNSGDSTFNFTINFTAVYIEDPVKGTLTPVTYGGLSNFTVPGNTARILLDELSASALGYPSGIPDGTELFIRYDALQGGSEYMPGGYNAASLAGGSGWYWLPASGGTVSAVNGFGPITKTGTVFGSAAGGASLEVFGFIVLGRGVTRAGLGFGDSLAFGSNANVVSTGFKGFGFVSRSSFESDGVSNPIPTLTIARPGNDAGDMSGVNIASYDWFQYCTHGITILGTNDLGATAGNTNPAIYSQYFTRMRQIWAAMKAAGMNVAAMMLQPNTTMAAPPSLIGQTDTSNWGLGGLVDLSRDTMLAEVAANADLDACLQFPSIRDPSDRNKWALVPPYGSSPQYHPGDGSNSVGEQDAQGPMSQELRAFWLS